MAKVSGGTSVDYGGVVGRGGMDNRGVVGRSYRLGVEVGRRGGRWEERAGLEERTKRCKLTSVNHRGDIGGRGIGCGVGRVMFMYLVNVGGC